MHGSHVSLIEGGCPDVVFVGESGQQVARTGTAVPDGVLFLPVFTQLGCEILLRQLHPLRGGEVAALALAHILWHQQVAAVDDVVPVLAAGRSGIASPEVAVGLLLVVELDGLEGQRTSSATFHVVDIAVVAQQHEETVTQRGVVLGEYVGQIEVGIDDAFPFGHIPVDGDGGLHLGVPLLVDVYEVRLVDAYLAAGAAPSQEVVPDEMDELLGIALVVVGHQSRVQRVAQQLVQLLELFCLVVRRAAGPVEVVLCQHAEDSRIGQEGYFLCIEGSEEHGRQV